MYDSIGRKKSVGGCGCVGGIIVIFLILAIVIPSCISYYSTKTYTVTVTDKEVKNYSRGSTYLIFTKLEDGETKVFEIEDSFFKLRFDSSDLYGEIQVGEKYEIEVIGWRIPFFSEYENIMRADDISD